MATPIERLPTELLQMIVELTTDDDVLALRQACPVLERAAGRLFANEILESCWSTFMLDIDRLRSTDTMLSKTYLAEYIQTLGLSLQVLPRFGKGLLTSMEDQHFKKPRRSNPRCCWCQNDDHEEEEETPYSFHDVKDRDLRFRPWREANASMASIFERASSLPNLRLQFDFRPTEDSLKTIKSKRPGLPQSFLKAAQASGCLVSSLSLDNRLSIDQASFAPSGELRRIAERLETFRFAVTPQHRNALFDDADRELVHVITTAAKLDSLTLMVLPSEIDFFELNGHQDHIPRLLQTSDLSRLQRLQLSGCSVHLQALLDIVNQCQGTLEHLTLHYFLITEPGDPVFQFLQHLSTIPHLQELDFEDFGRDARPLEPEIMVARFLLPDERRGREWSSTTGSVAAKQFLEKNIADANRHGGSLSHRPTWEGGSEYEENPGRRRNMSDFNARQHTHS